MRTTITLDGDLLISLQQRARREGKCSVSHSVVVTTAVSLRFT